MEPAKTLDRDAVAKVSTLDSSDDFFDCLRQSFSFSYARK